MLKQWLKNRVLVVAHVGDMDACAGFVAFKELAKILNPKIRLKFAFSGAVNKNGQQICDMFEITAEKITNNTQLNKFEQMILIDTQPDILPEFPYPQDLYIIDHHQLTDMVKNTKHKSVDPDAVSATEIIYKLFKQYKIKPSKKTAEAIMYGIISDTAGLKYAKTSTFKLVYEIITENNLDYKNLLEKIQSDRDIQEKMAWIKAAHRAKITRIGDKLLAVSHVGAYESSSASKLRALGANVALVISRKPKTTRISGRSAGVDLAEIFIKASNLIGGTGGGHPGAAVINVPLDKESQTMKYLINEVKKALRTDE